MDYSSPPGTPDGDGSTTPLQPLSHNQQRDSLFPSMRRANQQNHVDAFDARDSTVHDKVNQFNSLTMQSKALERKTADAALKRAMMGREEAEAEMRRYRDETRQLRKQIDDAKERERKVGERLETVMVGSFFFLFSFFCDHTHDRRGADVYIYRKTTGEQKKHMPTPRHSGKRRSGARERRRSKPRAH